MKKASRPIYERFAIPYDFKPQLSFREAVVSAAMAFLRIFFGSILFGVVGAYTLQARGAVRNVFAGVAIVITGLIVFGSLLALLLLGVSWLGRILLRKRV